MNQSQAIIGCAAATGVALLLAISPVRGQLQPPAEHGRSIGIHAAGAALPQEMAHVDTMLHEGQLDIASTQEDTLISGRVHERLKQMYKGLPVFGSALVRQMDGRAIISVSGRIYSSITIDVTPQISSEQAVDIAVANVGDGAGLSGEAELGVLPVDGESYKLAYRMRIRSNWDIRELAVDALSGEILYSRSAIEHIRTIGKGTGVLGDTKKMPATSTSSTFEAVDDWRPAPGYTLDFHGSLSRLNSFMASGRLFNSDIATDSDNVWTDAATVDAQVYQGWVYDYYYKRHGRRGLDDHDLEVDGIVHPVDRSEAGRLPRNIVNDYINNAFYCCDGLMTYGDGDGRNFTYFAGGLDVVGHEMSHGVTDFSSNLTYQDEPGALNEAFSDIMG